MSTVSEKVKSCTKKYYEDTLQGLFNSSDSEEVLLSHFGEFTPSKINLLIKLTEATILEKGFKRKMMRRICSVLIEDLQNVSIHGARDENENQHSYLLVSFCKDHFKIITGNLIHSEDVALIDFRLNEINNLSESELRKMYIETLCNENFSYKGGARLGFLTIAKKAIMPMNYSFQEIDPIFSYFTLEIKIGNKE